MLFSSTSNSLLPRSSNVEYARLFADDQVGVFGQRPSRQRVVVVVANGGWTERNSTGGIIFGSTRLLFASCPACHFQQHDEPLEYLNCLFLLSPNTHSAKTGTFGWRNQAQHTHAPVPKLGGKKSVLQTIFSSPSFFSIVDLTEGKKKREKKYFGSDNKARWFQCHSKDIDGNKPAFYRHSSNNRHAAISQRVPRTAYVTVGMFNSTDLSRSKSSQVFHSSSGREADKSPRSSCEKKKPAWNMIRCLTQDPLDVSDSKEGRDVSHSFTKSVYWAELSFFSSGDLEKEPANPPARVFSRHHISLQLTGRVVLSSSCIFTCGHFEKNYSVLLCVFYPYFLVGEHLRSNR